MYRKIIFRWLVLIIAYNSVHKYLSNLPNMFYFHHPLAMKITAINLDVGDRSLDQMMKWQEGAGIIGNHPLEIAQIFL